MSTAATVPTAVELMHGASQLLGEIIAAAELQPVDLVGRELGAVLCELLEAAREELDSSSAVRLTTLRRCLGVATVVLDACEDGGTDEGRARAAVLLAHARASVAHPYHLQAVQ